MWANGNFQVSAEQLQNCKVAFSEEEIFATDNLTETTAEEILKRHPMASPPNPWGSAGRSEELAKLFGDEMWKERLTEREPFDMDAIKEELTNEVRKSLGASERRRENLKQYIRSSLAMGRTVEELVKHARETDASIANDIQEAAASMNL